MKKINWKKIWWWALPIIALLAVTVIGYKITSASKPGFWAYWALIGLALIGVGLAAYFSASVRIYLGYVAGNLWKNNNWRSMALFVLAVIFTVSAILAGFGQPILTSSAKEANSAMAKAIANQPAAINWLGKIWNGTNAMPTQSIAAPTQVKVGGAYSSWWHWVWAGMLWLVAVIYLPISRRDELASAIARAYKKLERKKRASTITNTPTVAASAPPVMSEAAGSWLKKLFTKGGFLWHLVIDSIGEYIPGWLSKIAKIK